MAVDQRDKTLAEVAHEKNERGARRAILEDLFYDFHRSRRQVYTMNLFRGIFFGFGTVIGGTVVVTLLIAILSVVQHWFPFLDYVVELLRNAHR